MNNNLKNLKVLFVEDEESIRISLKKAIGDEFRQFTIAKDGEEGLGKFTDGKFDLIISDISMPKMSGLQMVTEIRKISTNIPIILLSAYSEKEKLLQAIDIGVNKYMIKPIDLEELLDSISTIIKQNRKNNPIQLQNSYLFDMEKKILYHDTTTVRLTKKELLLVTLLINNIGKTVLKEDIKSSLWGHQNSDDTLLRALIKRLRSKTNKNLIENFPGLGYKII